MYWELKVFNSYGQEIIRYDLDNYGYYDKDDIIKTTYYKNGLIKTSSKEGKSGFLMNYEYDEKGNWIQKILCKDNTLQYIY